MNPRVTDVIALNDHALLLTFSNSERKRFDCQPFFRYPVFRRLRDPAFFSAVKAAQGTACWPEGIDFDPDTLYVEGVLVGQEAGSVAA